MSIIHVCARLLGVFAPGSGRRRAESSRAARTRASRHVGLRLPAHRSPYGITQAAVLDGDAGPLVRPYLTGPVWAEAV
ncbi:hypothetical protein GCM10023237_44470 [Streptomyces coeruleoprunus]|uniref:hypothetical protein n=1 Tax=Streptomyces coeruleoprunus TaxID=285563 RepID=UPI0031E4F3BA